MMTSRIGLMKSSPSKRWVVLCVFCSLIQTGVAFAGASKGQRAPEFSLPSLRGPTVSLKGLAGKVVLVDFWAEWCEPCRKELPELEKLSREFGGKGVVVVSINI